MVFIKSIKYFSRVIKLVTSNVTDLNNLTIAFLRRLLNSPMPLITKRFGLGLLLLLLIIWKIWPDAAASYTQPGIDPGVESSIEVAETSTPDATIDPTPDVGASEQPAPEPEPTPPEQSQGWSRAAKWGLFIVSVGAGLLLGGAAAWYFWPTPPITAGVMGIISQVANSNELRDALVDNTVFPYFYQFLEWVWGLF